VRGLVRVDTDHHRRHEHARNHQGMEETAAACLIPDLLVSHFFEPPHGKIRQADAATLDPLERYAVASPCTVSYIPGLLASVSWPRSDPFHIPAGGSPDAMTAPFRNSFTIRRRAHFLVTDRCATCHDGRHRRQCRGLCPRRARMASAAVRAAGVP
jgi:hypothetical protein